MSPLLHMETLIGSQRSAAFCLRGGTPPLRPWPLGMPVVASWVMLGCFFFFCTMAMNSESFPLSSATAMEWEHIPSDFQLAQFESQLKQPYCISHF